MSTEPYLIITSLTVLFYSLITIVLVWGLNRGRRRPRIQRTEPLVSVLVAVRNEQENIIPLLTNLTQLDYPEQKLQILIVDDKSTDRTVDIVATFQRSHENVQLVRTLQTSTTLNGKANALQQAMRHATGEIIFLTDADCQVPQNWIRSHLSWYYNRVGMVGGFTLLSRPGQELDTFSRLQATDWLYLLAAGAGAAGLRRPLSVFGNNLSMRKKAFLDVNGYAGAGFSLIEDFALMRTMVQRGWRVLLPADPALVVQSAPEKDWQTFLQQRKRWAIGGRQVSFLARIFLAVAVAGRFIPLLPLIFGNIPAAGAALVAVFLCDYLLLHKAAGSLHRLDMLTNFFSYELFTFASSLIFGPVLLFANSVAWKGRVYKSTAMVE